MESNVTTKTPECYGKFYKTGDSVCGECGVTKECLQKWTRVFGIRPNTIGGYVCTLIAEVSASVDGGLTEIELRQKVQEFRKCSDVAAKVRVRELLAAWREAGLLIEADGKIRFDLSKVIVE